MAKTLLLDVEFLSYTLGGGSQDNLVVGKVVLFVWLDLNVHKCEYVVGVHDYMWLCIVVFLFVWVWWLKFTTKRYMTSTNFYKNDTWLLFSR